MNEPASVEGDARIRLFCALQLPPETLDALGDWQHALRPGAARLVPRDNLHLTLAFLGHRPATEVEAICGELHEAARAAGPIVLRANGYRETRSVGMLVFDDEGGAATALAVDLHARLHRIGVYEPERRPWLPHLTVVRFRERPRLSPQVPDLGAVAPSAAAVYLSKLRQAGAEYVVVQKFRLGG